MTGKFLPRLANILLILCCQTIFAQQTSIAIWRSQMQTCSLDWNKLYQTCNHFPKIETFNEDAAFEVAVKQWQKQYPNEEKAFWSLDEIKRGNPSAFYLGLSNGVEKKVFGNSIWEWVQASKITDARLAQLAPRFPKPVITDNPERDEKNYSDELNFWISLYPMEYEKLFNAPELTALNPYYTGYYKPVTMPAFLSAPLKETKPQRENFSRSRKGELNYQLSLRAWLFVYEPHTFTQQFGKDYEFSETFDAQKFRAMVIKKFEDTKHPSKELLESHPGK